MKQYIGTKLIEADPAERYGQEGYKVLYPDGYEICMEKIKDKVWLLLGFLLQTAVGGVYDGRGC